ncbi:hypothetical protein HZF08_24490 [Paenibacillus sp. CGMCC 1.16610]|uniref:hypothetical protein n=1 Tax=Paenibacillus anseongense TaxID=2682845 RepID=UPI0012F996B4|nr:hypothetical protein [Paenibacillus anseongense]MBA2941446.1 hypothetical protein [Paenibacillus sp. CGMCC 1.16610]
MDGSFYFWRITEFIGFQRIKFFETLSPSVRNEEAENTVYVGTGCKFIINSMQQHVDFLSIQTMAKGFSVKENPNQACQICAEKQK